MPARSERIYLVARFTGGVATPDRREWIKIIKKPATKRIKYALMDSIQQTYSRRAGQKLRPVIPRMLLLISGFPDPPMKIELELICCLLSTQINQTSAGSDTRPLTRRHKNESNRY